MRKFIISWLMTIIAPTLMIAQRSINIEDGIFVDKYQKATAKEHIEKCPNGYIVSYEFDKLTINEDVLYPSNYFIDVEGFEKILGDGYPSLPIKWNSFIVPKGKKAVVSIIDSSFINVPLKIAPSRPFQTELENRRTKPITPYNGLFPKSNIMRKMTREYRGYNLFDICLSPIKYDYQHESIIICKKLIYKISWCSDLENQRHNSNHALPSVHARMNNILNYRDLQVNDTIEDYLIITTPTFTQAAERFAEWKRTLGFRTQIIAQETWTNTDVKNTVSNIYNNPDYNLNYLLIIGDENDVPPYKYVNYQKR
jgi:hypothetical protein